MKKLLFILVFLLIPCISSAKIGKIGPFSALIGGATGSLDKVECDDIVGDNTDRAIATGDVAEVVTSTYVYWYVYDSTGSDSESSPTIIVPDDRTDCTTGQWELIWSSAIIDGEVITNDTIDDDSIDFTDVTLLDFGLAATHDTSGELDALYEAELDDSAGLLAALSDETGTGVAVFSTSPTLVTPILGTITSGVGTALTALDGENIQNDTIDDDSIDLTDVTLADITFDVGSVDTTEFGYLNGATSNIQGQLDNKETEDTAIVKDDESENITSDWEFSGGITIDAFLDLFDTPLTGAPTPADGFIYCADNSSWDPITYTGSVPYLVGYDGSDYIGFFDKDFNIISSGQSVALTPITGDADDFAANFTGRNLYGGTFVANAAGTAQLPVMAEGMNFKIITGGAYAVVVDTNAADGYLHNGTTGTEGKNITNASTAGDYAYIQYYTTDDWLITTNAWTPE